MCPESTFQLLQSSDLWDFCGCCGASVVIAFMIERNDISPGCAHSYICIHFTNQFHIKLN